MQVSEGNSRPMKCYPAATFESISFLKYSEMTIIFLKVRTVRLHSSQFEKV